jgi:hypothetical protein
MNNANNIKLILFRRCVSLSLAIVFCFIIFAALAIKFPAHTTASDPYGEGLTLYGKILLVLSFVLVPALYGTFAWIPIRKIRNGGQVGGAFFRVLSVLGILSTAIGYLLAGIPRIDCGNVCGPGVSSTLLNVTAVLLTLTVTVCGPIFALSKIHKSPVK